MQILRSPDYCKIMFEEDERYAGKTLYVDGSKGVDKEFYIYKSRLYEMEWVVKTENNATHCVSVDESTRDDVLDYILQKSKENDITLILVDR